MPVALDREESAPSFCIGRLGSEPKLVRQKRSCLGAKSSGRWAKNSRDLGNRAEDGQVTPQLMQLRTPEGRSRESAGGYDSVDRPPSTARIWPVM
jgi:hypothetical protein